MTIVEMLADRPKLFYPQQWYRGEAFTRMLPGEVLHFAPSGGVFPGKLPPANARLFHAVELLNAYLRSPQDPIWDRYLWTSDTDAAGQQIYIGGKSNTGAIEIHRDIRITDRFCTPIWS